MTDRMPLAAARAAVAQSADGRYGLLRRRGTLELGYHGPRGGEADEPA